MDHDALTQDLLHYLRRDRDALVWKLEGLGEYDVRRPMTPTGTTLLGLVKHVGSMACYYLGDAFDRPRPTVPWLTDDAADDADFLIGPDESRADVLAFWDASWSAADATLQALALDTVGTVPWWPEPVRHPTLHRVAIHLLCELDRHAGHADIVREAIDGSAGLRADNDNLVDVRSWPARVAELEQAAARFR